MASRRGDRRLIEHYQRREDPYPLRYKIEGLEDRIAKLEEAIADVLTHRVGDLPTRGFLKDNDASRTALAKLAALQKSK